jgi:hypothetical protein
VVAEVEQGSGVSDAELAFAESFLARMQAGPSWCRDVVDEYLVFLENDLLGNLKTLLPLLEKQKDNP